jgi:predicted glycosyltransferase
MGPYLPLGARERVQRLAAVRPRLRVLDFLSEPERLLRYAHRVVTMGGYNSVCEVLSSGRSALIVPRVAPRMEQLIRAERLRTLGLADMMHPSRFTPTSLGTWLASDAGPGAAARDRIDFQGLDRLPRLVEEVLDG